MGKKKGTEPFCGWIFCYLKKEGVKNRIKETRKWANHYQDFKADNEVKDNGAVQYDFAFIHRYILEVLCHNTVPTSPILL